MFKSKEMGNPSKHYKKTYKTNFFKVQTTGFLKESFSAWSLPQGPSRGGSSGDKMAVVFAFQVCVCVFFKYIIKYFQVFWF